MFTDGQFMTAAEKEKVYKGFVKFVASDFQRTKFTKAMYSFLNLSSFGFIAHYDIDGFYSCRFANPKGRIETLKAIAERTIYETASKKLDLELAVRELFKSHSDAIVQQAREDRKTAIHYHIAQLQDELKTL